jgi:hypothetical protein
MDGFYTTKEVRLELEERAVIIRHDTYTEEGNLKMSCHRATIHEIVRKKRELDQARIQLSKLKTTIEAEFEQRAAYYEALKERNDQAERVSLLKLDMAQQEDLLKKQHDEIANRKYRLLPQAEQLKKSQLALRASTKQMHEDQRQLSLQKYGGGFYFIFLISLFLRGGCTYLLTSIHPSSSIRFDSIRFDSLQRKVRRDIVSDSSAYRAASVPTTRCVSCRTSR